MLGEVNQGKKKDYEKIIKMRVSKLVEFSARDDLTIEERNQTKSVLRQLSSSPTIELLIKSEKMKVADLTQFKNSSSFSSSTSSVSRSLALAYKLIESDQCLDAYIALDKIEADQEISNQVNKLKNIAYSCIAPSAESALYSYLSKRSEVHKKSIKQLERSLQNVKTKELTDEEVVEFWKNL